jgi:hypothetical protein
MSRIQDTDPNVRQIQVKAHFKAGLNFVSIVYFHGYMNVQFKIRVGARNKSMGVYGKKTYYWDS